MRIGLVMLLFVLVACTPPAPPQAYSDLPQLNAYCLRQFGVVCPEWFLRGRQVEVAAALPRNDAGATEPTSNAREEMPGSLEVRLVQNGGVLKVPASINGAITLDFILDSGAADVSIPADVFLTLVRTGTIEKRDLLGKQNYQLADGRSVSSQIFRIRSLKVGGHTLSNVLGSVAPASASLLLGQSFLSRFSSWSIDNNRHVLVLN